MLSNQLPMTSLTTKISHPASLIIYNTHSQNLLLLQDRYLKPFSGKEWSQSCLNNGRSERPRHSSRMGCSSYILLSNLECVWLNGTELCNRKSWGWESFRERKLLRGSSMCSENGVVGKEDRFIKRQRILSDLEKILFFQLGLNTCKSKVIFSSKL